MLVKKVIASGPEARAKLLKGAMRVGDLVGRTLGPNGRNGILYSAYHAPKITNDGVSIARAIVLDDEIEDLGAQVVVEAAMKTNQRAGDGTTTATVIASKLIKDCAEIIAKEDGKHDDTLEGISTKVNTVTLSREITDARTKVIERLKEIAKPVQKGDLKKIVSTSLGKVYPEHVDMVTDILEKVGVDGYVAVEDNFGTKFGIENEVHEGMRFLGSYASPVMTAERATESNIYFNKRKEARIEDCPVLVTNHRIDSPMMIKKIVEQLRAQGKRKLCIVSYGYEANFTTPAVAAFVNILRGVSADGLRILAIKAPALTTDQLSDICAFTGAKLVNKEWKDGASLDLVGTEVLGFAKKIVVDEDHTSMDGGAGDVTKRVEELKAEIENEKDIAFKEQTKRRLGALKSGFAIIRVGAPTEPERDYIKLKIEDAVNAAKAALEEGVIGGGGIPLSKIAEEFGKDSIVYGALREPHERIKANAGGIIEVPKGIIDPVKVTRMAVLNAFSVAAQLITADVAITQKRRTFMDELQQGLSPEDNEDVRAAENDDVSYKT